MRDGLHVFLPLLLFWNSQEIMLPSEFDREELFEGIGHYIECRSLGDWVQDVSILNIWINISIYSAFLDICRISQFLIL
jgi:hypothetical protein